MVFIVEGVFSFFEIKKWKWEVVVEGEEFEIDVLVFVFFFKVEFCVVWKKVKCGDVVFYVFKVRDYEKVFKLKV